MSTARSGGVGRSTSQSFACAEQDVAKNRINHLLHLAQHISAVAGRLLKGLGKVPMPIRRRSFSMKDLAIAGESFVL
jgi:hypothetical protein